MSLRLFEKESEKEAGMLNSLQLAYIGDAVWETVVRGLLVHRGLNVRNMHHFCVDFVNAHAQSVFLHRIEPLLTTEEAEIIRRGKNAHSHHPSPKNQSLEDYTASTGFEALIGYLYMTGNEERILHLSDMIIKGEENNG